MRSTLHYKLFIVAKVKKLQGPLWRKSHNNDCRHKCVFSFRRNDNSDVAVVTCTRESIPEYLRGNFQLVMIWN